MPFFVILILIIVGGIGLDLLSKLLVYNLMEEGQSIPILGNFFKISFVKNKGMAFGLLKDHRWVFIVVSIIVIAGLTVYLFRFSKDSKLTKIGMALIISGGLGNMVDRIGLGYVVDMIDFSSFFPYIFNVADSMVTVGVAITIITIVYKEIKDYKEKNKANKEEEKTEQTEEIKENDTNDSKGN